jgi:hypothetical protein
MKYVIRTVSLRRQSVSIIQAKWFLLDIKIISA